ncbi:MAG: HD domain-containing protein [Chlorobium sp.]|nr:HD domain-containing protein [Chlorobium sp.]MCW8818708.1 HD domain-containing protein [Ignavibacteriaceae bacterium]
MISNSFLFRSEGGFIRLPVWGHIPLNTPLKKILSHPAFLRLKGIRQLSFAQQVYPGANHTRFEHSIGVYHLMKLILQRIVTNPLAESLQNETLAFDDHTCKLLLASAILHDIGHYPHAHVLEEQAPFHEGKAVFAAHETLVDRFLFERHEGFSPIAEILESDWGVDPLETAGIIKGTAPGRFKKLISGTLDPDKMDYLMRDAHHCNIPYGSIDIERLIESFVPDPELQRFAITEKGIAPLESLLFSKYMMMRNVYWHHTSRTFSVMLRRMLQDAINASVILPDTLRTLFYDNSDDRVLHELTQRTESSWPASKELLGNIMQRKIYKRALTFTPYRNGAREPETWMFAYTTDHERRTQKEKAICDILNRHAALGLKGHEVLIDPPSLKDVFDYADLRELRVHPTRRENLTHQRSSTEPSIRFDDFGESVFRSDFILSFERYTKKFRIVCRDDLRELIVRHEDEIMETLRE